MAAENGGMRCAVLPFAHVAGGRFGLDMGSGRLDDVIDDLFEEIVARLTL